MSPQRNLSAVTTLLAVTSLVVGAIDENRFPLNRIITKDVAILGGGASGAHAAVRLREDFGKSTIVIEKQEDLGGHVETYTDPATGKPYDYGVQSYLDYGSAKDFFARFNVSITTPTSLSVTSNYADFSTGLAVTNYTPPNSTTSSTALSTYLKLCELYEDMILPGYWKFPSPDQIPPDLLLNFHDFAQKYGIEAALPRIFEVSGLRGNQSTIPTLYGMQAFGAPVTRAFVGGSTFVPASHNNSELYGKIGTLLGTDVLYSSQVIETERSSKGVKLVVRTKDGSLFLIRAKRLLITFEPTLENMAPLDLDEKERAVFSKWTYTNAFAGIVIHPSLPVNVSLSNIPLAAAPSNYLVVPSLPYVGRFAYIGPPGFRVIVGGDKTLNITGAKAVVRDAIDKLIAAGTLPAAKPGDELKFVAFADHGAMHLSVGEEELRGGFIQELYGLQRQRGTWYTGAAWCAQYTTNVWAFTETILERLVEGL